jgi:hypothetical protein
MRRVLLALLLVSMFAGFVSAAGVSYYPDREAFQLFLESNKTYRVVPGEDPWSKGWAFYVDRKLSTVKDHGDDTLVLVGNVYDNELMAKLWNRTGLDPSLSLSPSIVVLNNTVMVTGSRDNLYLTYEAFKSLRCWTLRTVLTALGAIILYLSLMGLLLREDRSYAGSIFLMGAALLGEWALLRPYPSGSVEKTLYLALARLHGAHVSQPNVVLASYFLRVLPPVEEFIWVLRWFLIFLLLGITTYTAPKKERSLGVVAFFLTLSAPSFREWILTSNELLGLVSLAVVLAVASSSNFTESIGGVLATLLISVFTVIGALINPYLLFLPLLFVLTFPGRASRNVPYLLLSGLGAGLVYYALGASWLLPWYPTAPRVEVLGGLLRETLIQMAVLLYTGILVMKVRKVRKKGPTAFTAAVATAFLLLTPFRPELFPYSVFSLSILAVRLLRASPQI